VVTAILLRPMRSLLGPELEDIAGRFTGLLRQLAAEARDLAGAA
jgi:hypothetical protein